MVDVYLADEPAAVAWVVNGILDFLRVSVAPLEQILVSDLNLATVPDKVDPEFRVVQVSLEANPTLDLSGGLLDLAVGACGRAGFLVGR